LLSSPIDADDPSARRKQEAALSGAHPLINTSRVSRKVIVPAWPVGGCNSVPVKRTSLV